MRALEGYTVFDDITSSFDEWLASTPYWVVLAVLGIIALFFIISLVKKFIVLAVVLAVIAVGVCGMWFYSANY